MAKQSTCMSTSICMHLNLHPCVQFTRRCLCVSLCFCVCAILCVCVCVHQLMDLKFVHSWFFGKQPVHSCTNEDAKKTRNHLWLLWPCDSTSGTSFCLSGSTIHCTKQVHHAVTPALPREHRGQSRLKLAQRARRGSWEARWKAHDKVRRSKIQVHEKTWQMPYSIIANKNAWIISYLYDTHPLVWK